MCNYTVEVEADNPDISVVIPTLPSRSVDPLPLLKQQKGVEYEVIVVNDKSIDISQARNAGIQNAKAEIIALTDDDTRPPENWLKTAVNELRSPKIVLMEGPIIERESPPRLYRGANLAFLRSTWERVGGFDSRFAGWLEDCVFGWEIENQFGLRATKYVDSFRMSHPDPLRSSTIEENERLARREYPEQYFAVIRRPSSIAGKVLIAIASQTYPLAPPLWEKVL